MSGRRLGYWLLGVLLNPSHWLRHERAKELFLGLDAEMAAFLASKPFYFEYAIRPATADEVTQFVPMGKDMPGRLKITPGRSDLWAHEARLRFRSEPPLEQWSIRLSEVVQHLRNSLDNLVYAMAQAHSGQLTENDARALQFPICEKKADWDAAMKSVRALKPEKQVAIEGLQPFRFAETKASPNWTLHVLRHLSNIDKHRRLTLAGAKPSSIVIEGFQTIEDGYTPITQMELGALTEGCVASLTLSPVQFPRFKLGEAYSMNFALPQIPLPKGPENLLASFVVGTLIRDVHTVIETVEKA